MKKNANRIVFIILPLCVLFCIFLSQLKTVSMPSVTVDSQNGVWDLRGIDFSKTYAHLVGDSEYVSNALLTPDEFDASSSIKTGALPDDVEYATFRMRLLLREDQLVALAGFNSGNASRMYINGRLLGGAGTPGATKETTVSSQQWFSFTAWPEGGVVEIVEQSSNFVHKDNLESTLKYYVGNEGAISNMTTHDNAVPVIEIGVYLLLFIVQMLLFLTLPHYRANLWLALLCLMWALRTGVTGMKVFLSLFPWLTWQPAFRIEYLAIPASLLLLTLAYRELFPGVLQKGFRIAVYVFSAIAAVFILLADTKPLSNYGVPMSAICAVAAAYVLVRVVWTMRQRKPNAEQAITLAGLCILLLAVANDTFYFSNNLGIYLLNSVSDTALILLALFQMVAMLNATMREAAAARTHELVLAAENARKQALLERAEFKPGQVVTKGPLTLDSVTGQAFLNGEDMRLAPKEFALLSVLAQHEGDVVTKEFLYEAAWKQPLSQDANALKKEVSRLRGKLAESSFEIVTQRGKGYLFQKKA